LVTFKERPCGSGGQSYSGNLRTLSTVAGILAKIGNPVPAVHAFDANNQVIPEGIKKSQQRFRLSLDLLVQQYLALLVEDADIKAAGVQVDSTIMSVSAMVKVHESSPS
jgi:hypothetical protein